MGPLVCPQCKLPLKQDKCTIVCENCKKNYPIEDGVFNFIGEKSDYWGEVSPEYMEKLNFLARKYGFETALNEVTVRYPDLTDYLLNSGRIDWIFHCLNLKNNYSCLDLGSGWGSLAFPLAKYFKEVWSLEAVKQRIEFQRIRREQEKISNVNLTRASISNLPFSNDYFDLVVANEVLEWAGINDVAINPRKTQLNFLREIIRVLKPQGCLYIGIKNRFAWPNFMGAHDHSDLPFTSILPRKLADVEVKILRKTGNTHQKEKIMSTDWASYRTYTYSFMGYRKLLREAGFNDIDFFWVSPGYCIPMFSARLNDIRSFLFFLKNNRSTIGGSKGLVKRFLVKVATFFPESLLKIVFPILWPDFLIYAYKNQRGHSFESELLNFEDRKFLQSSYSGSVKSGINYFVFRDNEPQSVIKFPRFQDGAKRLERKELLCERFNKVKIRKRDVNGIRTFIEPMLKGKPLEVYNPIHNQISLKWLIEFQNSTKKGFWNFEDLEKESKNLSDHLSEICLPIETRLRVSENLQLFLKHLEKVRIEKTSEHGDFWSKNILLDESRKIYVIDWEFFKEEGNPLFDFCFFIITNCSVGLQPEKSFYENFTGKGKYAPILRNLLIDFSKEKSLSQELIYCAIPYVMLRCIYRYSANLENWDSARGTFIKLLKTWDKVNL